jgi:hypothetical protein
MTSVLEAALRYASLGLSVHPVAASKEPLMSHWRVAQDEAASGERVQGWFEQYPEAGVAIVCGSVSGGLIAFDVDNRTCSDWMQEHLREQLSKTWVVRTGSGKLHIYLRSKETCYTHNVTVDGVKIGEVRADGTHPAKGSYVLAPPSPYDFGGVQGFYSTLFGGPDRIPTVPDASAFFEKLAKLAYSSTHAGGNGTVTPTRSRSKDVDPPAADLALEKLEGIIKTSPINGKIKRTILEGPNKADWEHRLKDNGEIDRSEVDFAIISALRESGISREDIEAIYATFPVGEMCYRNKARPNHGKDYLYRTLDSIDAKMERAKDASGKAEGKNFVITEAKHILYEPSIYELGVQRKDTGQIYKVKIVASDIRKEGMFKDAVLSYAGFIPRVKDEHEGKKFEDFTDIITAMATVEEPPKDATETGHLREIVLEHLRGGGVMSRPPEDPELTELGWRDDKAGVIYVRGPALVQIIGRSYRGAAPKADKIWSLFDHIGGKAVYVPSASAKKPVQLWQIPLWLIDGK